MEPMNDAGRSQQMFNLRRGNEIRTALQLVKHYRLQHVDETTDEDARRLAEELVVEISYILGPAGEACHRCEGSGREP